MRIPGPDRPFGHCKMCGQSYSHPIEQAGCCLGAPKAIGWCAWCGEALKPPRVFCNSICSHSWFEDIHKDKKYKQQG